MQHKLLFILLCLATSLGTIADSYTLTLLPPDCAENWKNEYPNLVTQEHVLVTAVPDEGFRFVKWAEDDNTDNPRTVTINSNDITLTPVFEEIPPEPLYTVTLQWTECDEGQENKYENLHDGESVQVTAVPDDGFRFVKWAEDDNTDNPRTVTINSSDITLTPVFEEIPPEPLYTVTLQWTECDEGQENKYENLHSGESVQVTAVPDEGFHFVKWAEDDNIENPRTILVTADVTYVATFAPDMHELTWDFVGGATSSAEDAYSHGQVMYNTPITPPADPTKDGYTFTGWSPEVSALMPDEDVTYTATWAPAQLELYDDVPAGQTLGQAQASMQATLEAWAGKTTDVIIHRTLWRDGYYNTLCLPFDLASLDGTPLAGGQLMEYTGADVYATTLDVHIQEASSITAYKPYLISFDLDENITSMTFTDVTIAPYSPVGVQAGDGVNFLATITPTKLNNGDKSLLFVAAENTLNWPSEDDQSTMKGFRAYFKVNDTPKAQVIRRGMPAQLVVGSRQTPTGLESLSGLSREGVRKVLHDNRILIIRNGVVYDAIGNKQVK